MVKKIDSKRVQQRSHPNLDVLVGDVAMVEPQGVGERFRTGFVGWEGGRYVIMRLPSRLDLREHLYAGKLVIVRYLSCAGEVCGFESEVQGVNYKPQHIFFVDFPQKVEVFSLRKENRVDAFLPATLIISDEVSMRASILNLSSGGARIGLPREEFQRHPLTIDQQFVCQFQMLGQEAPAHSFIGLVRTITEEPEKVFLGVQFKEVSDTLRNKIEEYVQSVSEYLGGSCAPRL